MNGSHEPGDDLLERAARAKRPLELITRPGDRVLIVGSRATLPDHMRASLASANVEEVPTDAPLDALAEHAPHDLVIVTKPVRSVAWAWVQHTRPGGLLLCVLDPSGLAGHAVLLRCETSRAFGRFLIHDPGLDTTPVDPERAPSLTSLADDDSRHARTSLPLRVWELGVPWYLATATMPDGLTLNRVHDNTGTVRCIRLATADGSWCEITEGHPDGRRHVAEGGHKNLFHHLAGKHREWHDLGCPEWERLTVAVTPDAHVISLDDGRAAWTLPE